LDKYKVIFHVDENNKMYMALKNIDNLIKDLGEDKVEVELLANSEAVSHMSIDSNKYVDEIRRLAQKGIRFAVCNNSLNAFRIEKQQVIAEAVIVASGIGELVIKQANGWSYIRP
jgi:uncharacterized protein